MYLWICIWVFVYFTVGNIRFDVLEPWAFQKYSIIRVYKVFSAWWRRRQPGGKSARWTLSRADFCNIKNMTNMQNVCRMQIYTIDMQFFQHSQNSAINENISCKICKDCRIYKICKILKKCKQNAKWAITPNMQNIQNIHT